MKKIIIILSILLMSNNIVFANPANVKYKIFDNTIAVKKLVASDRVTLFLIHYSTGRVVSYVVQTSVISKKLSKSRTYAILQNYNVIYRGGNSSKLKAEITDRIKREKLNCINKKRQQKIKNWGKSIKIPVKKIKCPHCSKRIIIK